MVVDLAGLVHVAAVNQLHPGLALSGVVLLVLMPAIEKGGIGWSSKQAQVPVPWPEANCASRDAK